MTYAMRFLFFLLAGLLIPMAAPAQQYQQWSDPDSRAAAAAAKDAANERLQGFVDRLNALIGGAEKSRAADPQFLRDLRGLAQGFDRPWRTRLLSDDFVDGDFTRDPRWTVTAGRYWVESGWGLRSAVKAERAAPQQKRLSGRDAAAAIFGQILQQALDPNARAGGGTTATATSPGTVLNATAIQTGFRMTNAFAIEVDFSSWAAEGRLEIGPYQSAPGQGAPGGAERATGYTLAYTPGGGLELLRVSRRGTSIIDSAPAR